jgi:hypothetical protein
MGARGAAVTQFEIKHQGTNAVLYTGGGESLREIVEKAIAAGANLAGANLARANLDGANLDGAYLDGANLAGAYLAGANLDGANLARANLARANLDGAYLAGANLAGANLGRANLDGANLAGAYLAGANLAGANLGRANLDGANLAGAYLDGANLDGNCKLIGNRPILQVGPIGSRCAYLISFITDAGVMVRAGCWYGLLAEFGPRVVEEHGNSVHGREYAAAIALIEAHASLWTPAGEVAREAA